MLSINSYDLNTGGGYGRISGHPTLGTTSGQTSVKHMVDYDTEDVDYDPEELDLFIDDVLKKKINKRIDTQSSTVVDPGMRRRDAGTFTKNIGGYMQEAVEHTNKAASGLSPRLTYRGAKTKGPALGAQGAATYIRNKPGRISGTQYGTSRAPLPRHYEDDQNIWNLQDIDPHMNAIKRQNRVRKFIFSLEET